MSSQATPPPSSPTVSQNSDTRTRASSVNLSAAADAAARRAKQPLGKAPNEKEQFEQERETRQNFRRLIDPGIIRPNSKEVATVALQTLSKLAENLLREPDNPKYQSFKPTNEAIKKRLVEPVGALEYAIALGFRASVVEFQPFYTFNKKYMDELRIGAAMLREAVAVDAERNERVARAREIEKAAADTAKRNVALAFLDDRKSREIRTEREKAAREAQTHSHTAVSPPPTTEEPPPRYMPGSGHTLTSATGDVTEDTPNENDRLIDG